VPVGMTSDSQNEFYAAVWILFVMQSIHSSPLICRNDASPRFETAEKKDRGAETKNDNTHVKKSLELQQNSDS
jgi:hypothetical protein